MTSNWTTSARRSRRTMLRMVGGAVGAAALGTGAGCSAVPSGGGGPPDYTRWVPRSGAGDIAINYVTAVDVAPLSEHAARFRPGRYERVASGVGTARPVTLDGVDVERRVTIGVPRMVATGTVDRSAVDRTLRDAGCERAGDHEGFTLYRLDGPRAAWGVADDAVVYGKNPGQDPVRTVTAVVDAERGAADRAVAADDDLARVTATLGNPTVAGSHLLVRPYGRDQPDDGLFEGQVADGVGITVEGERSRLDAVRVFESGDDVDLDVVERWTRTEQFGPVEDVAVERDGRTVVVSGTVATGDLGERWLPYH